jgi:ubiquinone/menaquinone biosynthesis C-methylase UbiE
MSKRGGIVMNGKYVLPFLLLSFCMIFAHAQKRPQYVEVNRDDRLGSVERILDAIGIKEGNTVGDAGAGTGYFTFKLVRRVGPKGKVLANDIDSGVLKWLEDKCKREGVHNVVTVLGDVDDPRFPRKDLDAICLCFALHDFTHPVEWMQNAKRYLKPGGKLAVIDYAHLQRESYLYDTERVRELAKQAGYEVANDYDFMKETMFLVLETKR